jgi:hypothetical protein
MNIFLLPLWQLFQGENFLLFNTLAQFYGCETSLRESINTSFIDQQMH